MISYPKSPLLRVSEFYFDEPVQTTRADIVRYLWRPTPIPGVGCDESHTLVLDLAESSEKLLADMHTETRYRIRRAEKDGFKYDFWCAADGQRLAEFYRFYDRFASRKHLVGANQKRLSALAQIGVLDLSRVRDSSGRTLVWHAHFCAAPRARGLHSASLLPVTKDPSLRGLIARANCYHTWSDILRFQQHGLAVYDLGGWYGGTEDAEKIGINRFKASFGGVVISEFNSELGATGKGRFALAVKAMLLSGLARSRGWKLLEKPRSRTTANLH